MNTYQSDFSITPVFRNGKQYCRVDSSERVRTFLDNFQTETKIQSINEVKPAVGYCLTGNIQIDEDSLEWEQVK